MKANRATSETAADSGEAAARPAIAGQLLARLVSTFAALWAGTVLGGSLIAAPAKFQAPSLTRAVALDVGRMQFYWLGIAEMALCALLLVLQPNWTHGSYAALELTKMIILAVVAFGKPTERAT